MPKPDSPLARLMRLMEFADSALPVGGFTFSNTLESAAAAGVVHDAATLEAYTRTLARQAATTDGIAALAAWRAAHEGDFAAIADTDRRLAACKMNDEARRMSSRMGRKLLELAQHLFAEKLLARMLAEIRQGSLPGCYPVAQGVLFAACGLSEEALFAATQYGVRNMLLSAALRCVRVSHIETQQILFRAADEIDTLYAEVRTLSVEEMHAFAPQADILAAMHEKGSSRMFMS